MSTEIKDRVQVKLFIGFQITSEIRMHLNDSREWDLVNTKAASTDEDLVEVNFQGKSYLGRFSKESELEISQIAAEEKEAQKLLERYCPLLDSNKFSICVFPQVLVS